MPDRWNEERERRWRERSWRPEAYGRGDDDRQGRAWKEDRSFGEPGAPRGARFEGQDRDRVFGEADTGAQYNQRTPRPGGGAYGAGGSYGAGEGYGRDEGGRGAYDTPTGRGERQAPRFQSQDYTQGGRYYGDDRRQPIYREEYAQGRRDYGPAPRGYDAERGGGQGYGYGGGDYGRDNRDLEDRYARDMGGRPSSGGTGGYDYERGYGDAGRPLSGDWQDRDYGGPSPAMMRGEYGPPNRGSDRGPDRERDEAGFEGHARAAGDFLHRAGERLSSWFGGLAGEGRDEGPRRYSSDFGREARWEADRGHRGRGPKGYQRPDERISDEVHHRLTDDAWLDASNISASVSGGEVTLSGTVESREAKHRAERLIEEISGVKHVQNNLRIDRGDMLTGSGRGFGDSVAEAKMREGETGSDGDAATRSTTRRT